MKVVLLLIISTIFCANFCAARTVESITDVKVDDKVFAPEKTSTTENGRKYYEYIVKYGEINDGEWFKPAKLVSEPEHDVRCADWHESQLPKKLEVNYETYKNCLVLKIDTNNLAENKPVLVYIPGFDLSSGDVRSTSGHYLLDKDVVLVTVQYRVGVLGFLSTNTEEIPGNAGVHDVILALKWIKNHISKFGGDPNRVTVFGQYKAAGLIGVLTMSPLAEGLFNQVIYQSGNALLSNLTTTNPLDFARKVATEINCDDVDEVADLNKCILNAKYSDLLKAYHNIILKDDGEVALITIGGPSNVLPGDEDLSTRIENDKFRKYPTMAGVVDHPAILLIDAYNEKEYSRFSMKFFQEEYKDKVESSTPKIEDPEEDAFAKELMSSLLDFANTLIKGLVKAFLPLEIDMAGMEIKTDTMKILVENKKAGAPSYMYAFKYHGSQHYFPKKEESWLKNYVTLLDDNTYLFTPEKVISDDDKRINKIMVDLWTSFAQNGVPQSSEVEWPQIDDSDGPYLIIDKTVKVGNDYSKELTPLIDCESEKTCEWLDESAAENVLKGLE